MLTEEDVKKTLAKLDKLFEVNNERHDKFYRQAERCEKRRQRFLEIREKIWSNCAHCWEMNEDEWGYDCKICGKHKCLSDEEIDKKRAEERERRHKAQKVQLKIHTEKVKHFLAVFGNQDKVVGLDRSIVTLNLSYRAVSCLIGVNIKTIRELKELIKKGLWDSGMKNCGEKIRDEILTKMAPEIDEKVKLNIKICAKCMVRNKPKNKHIYSEDEILSILAGKTCSYYCEVAKAWINNNRELLEPANCPYILEHTVDNRAVE